MNKRTITRREEIDGAIQDFNTDVFAFDVETREQQTDRTTSDFDKMEVFVLSLYDGSTSIVVDLYDVEDKDGFLQQLFAKLAPNRAKGQTVIAHNIPFDVEALSKHGVSLYNGDWYDTLIAHHLIDERKRHGLKTLAESYLNVNTDEIGDAYKPDRMTDRFEEYARNDTVWAWKLAKIFNKKMQDEGVYKLFKKVEMPFQRCIVEMEKNGVKFNEEKARKYRKELGDEIKNMQIQMCDLLDLDYETQFTLCGGTNIHTPINFDSNAQIRELLYEDLGLPAEVETDGGQPATSEKALKALKGEHPIIEKLLEYRTATQFKSNFFDTFPELVTDGVIRPDFLDFTTVTGRLSSREPNMQNQPRDDFHGVHPRECFEARDGKKMIAIDYSSQELRVAAQVTQDGTMIRVIKEGIDPHLLNANTVFDLGIPEEKLKESHPEYKDIKAKYKKKRQKAKIFTYGILYGATKYRISNEFDCSLEQAEAYLEQYFDKYPGVRKKMDEVEETIKKQGYVTSMYGRKRRFNKRDGKYGKYYPPSAFRQGFNFCVGKDTYVWTKDKGLQKIKDVTGKQTVWDGNQWVSGNIVQSGEKDLYRVWFNNGQHIDVTKDHKLLTVNSAGNENWKTIDEFSDSGQWVRINNKGFRTNSSITLPNKTPKSYKLQPWNDKKYAHNAKTLSIEDIENDYQRGLFLGSIASDGSYQKNGRITIYIGEHEYEQISDTIKKIIPWRYVEQEAHGSATIKLTIHSVTLAKELNWLDLKNKVHPYITSNKELLRGYLKGLFDGDGGVQVTEWNKPECKDTSTIHLAGGKRHQDTELFEQVQQSLLMFGIRSRLAKYDKSTRLKILHKHNGKFKEKIGFINQDKQEKIIVRERDTQLGSVEKVDKVEYIGEETVYDIVETDTHRFIANGFVAHNCIQGASADMMRVGMIKVLNYAKKHPEYGINLLMTVHDEVVLECDEEYAETVCEECTELVSEVVGDDFVVDMPADGDIGDNYAEAK